MHAGHWFKGSKVIIALDPEGYGEHTNSTETNNDKKRAPPSTHIDSLK